MGTGWSQEDEASASQPQPPIPSGKEPEPDNHTASKHAANEAKTKVEVEVEPRPLVKAEAKVEVKLPHNYELILRDADFPVERSSPDKLYDQLCGGVFLNQKRQKYWVEKKSACNCFMLYARHFRITWTEDNRLWNWLCLNETSNATVDVAELLNVCWLEVHGNFDTRKLSPGILYEVAMVIMLTDPAYGWEVPINLRLTLPNGSRQERKENLMVRPRGVWVEIPLGEFKTSEENLGGIEVYVYEYEAGKWKRGLLLKGIAIRPKN